MLTSAGVLEENSDGKGDLTPRPRHVLVVGVLVQEQRENDKVLFSQSISGLWRRSHGRPRTTS